MFVFIRRWCARLILAAVLLLGITVAAVYFLSETVLLRYRPEIEAALSQTVGGAVKIAGVKLLVLPNIKLVVRDATLDWKSPDGDLTIAATIPRLYVSVSIPPLLHRKVAFRAVDLSNPFIRVTKIDIPLPQRPAQPDQTEPPTETGNDSSWFSGGTSLPRIRIKNGSFTFINGERKWEAADFILSSKVFFERGTGTIPDLDLKFRLLSAPPNSVPVPLNVTLSGTAKLSREEISLDSLTFKAAPEGQAESARVPLSIESRSFVFNRMTREVISSGAAIQLSGSRIEGSGSHNLASDTGRGQITLKDFSTETIAAVNKLVPFASPVNSGTMSGAVSFEYTPGERSVRGRNIEVKKLGTKSMKLDRLMVSEINATSKADGSGSMAATLSSSGFQLKTSTGENYAASNTSGTVRASKDKKGGISSSGDLSVEGFLYADSAVEVSKVNAKLQKISGTVKPNGDANFVIPVAGTSVEVKNAMVQVLGVRAANGPITVSIPAKGGYSVSGPITAEGGRVIYDGHDIKEIGGAAKILITGPEKRFTITSVSGVTEGQNVKLAGEMSMVADRFQFSNVTGALFNGTVSARFSYGRGNNNEVSGEAAARNVQLEPFMKIFAPQVKRKVAGTVNSFDLAFKGRRGEILKTALGKGSMHVNDGLVTEIGVDGALVKALRNIPIIGSQFDIAPAPAAQGENGGFFVLRSSKPRALRLAFTLGSNAIETKDLNVSGQFGTLEAAGTYNFDTGFKLEGTVVFLEKTAKRLAGPLKPIGSIFGALGRVEIPLTVVGPGDDVRVRFDPSRTLSMTAPTRIVGSAVNEVGNTIGSIGNFVLGRSSPTPAATPQGQ